MVLWGEGSVGGVENVELGIGQMIVSRVGKVLLAI